MPRDIMVLDDHTLAVTAAGSLAPANPVAGDTSALDADKLHDALIPAKYRLTNSPTDEPAAPRSPDSSAHRTYPYCVMRPCPTIKVVLPRPDRKLSAGS